MPPNSLTVGSRVRTGPAARMTAVGAGLLVCSIMAVRVAGLSPSRASEAGQPDREGRPAETEPEHGFHTERIRGRVVWLAEALKEHFGISTVPEVQKNGLALLTSDHQLFPIVENLRGRAFRKDERLRQMDVEILARCYDRQPLVQVLRVYQLEDDQRYELDYWCDVCAIVMFETGPCDCCQDNNRLRRRLVTGDDAD